jgi:glycosyltransferase involved in cell wall biosynthesis
MNRRVIESASVIVVHTEWLREKVLQHFSHKDVRVVPLAGVPLPSTPFSEDSPIVVLGGIGRHKQVSTVIAAFSQVARQIPNARLLIVGRADDPAEIRMLKKVVRRERLSKRVAWALNVNREKYLAHLASARCVVSLRPETAGEMSNVLVEAWGAGKVAITSDQPQFRTFDERYCRRVSLGDEAERDLTKELLATYTDPEPVRTGGQLARHLIDNEYSLPVVSEQYLNIVREVRTSRAASTFMDRGVHQRDWPKSHGDSLKGFSRLTSRFRCRQIFVSRTMIHHSCQLHFSRSSTVRVTPSMCSRRTSTNST